MFEIILFDCSPTLVVTHSLCSFCKTQGLEWVVKDCHSARKTYACMENYVYRPADTLNIR